MTSQPAADPLHGRRRQAHRASVVVLALALGCAFALVHPRDAQATSYRFWTYWAGDSGSWAFSAIGAARRPPDGAVEGWRFEVSPASSSSQPPRTSPSFADLCGGRTPAAGDKLVGIVIDYGTSADAPPGERPPSSVATSCQEVSSDATGYAVLGAVASVRTAGGLVCGIGGYPARGCGEPVADPAPTPTPTRTAESGPGAGTSGPGSPGSAGRSGGAGPSSSSGHGTQPQPSRSSGPGDGAHHNHANRSGHQASPDTGTGSRDTAPTDPAASPVAATDVGTGSGGSPAGVLVGLGIVGLVVAAGVVVARRRT